jgi:hypothetical protein
MHRSLPAALTALLAAGLLLAGQPAAAAPAADPVAPASEFTPVSPVRVLDTRAGTGAPTGPVGAGRVVTLDLSARVPASATAVVLNVTGVSPTTTTFVTVFAHGAPRPTASNINLVAGDVRANQVTVALGAGRKVSLYNNTGSVHLVADLAGHYGTDTGAGFTPLSPDSPVAPRAATRCAATAPSGPGAATAPANSATARTASPTRRAW